MAKNVAAGDSESPDQLHTWPDGYDRPEVPRRVVEVGTVAGFEAAVANAQQWDIIEFAETGIYSLTATPNVQAPDVIIRAAAGMTADQVTVRGRGMDYENFAYVQHGIYVSAPRLTLERFTIDQVYRHAVTFDAGATGPIIRGMRLLDTGEQHFKTSQFPAAINDGLIEDCYIAYTNGSPLTNHGGGIGYINGIDLHNGANWIIRRNTLENLIVPDNATPDNWYAPAILVWDRSSNTLVENNILINCQRAIVLGLAQRTGTPPVTPDHSGGIVRNNMIVLPAGAFSAARIANADAQILLWDCTGGIALHNTILTNGQCYAIQGRWTTDLVIANNLSDNIVHMRTGAAFTGSGHQANAQASWFTNAATGNLRLNSTGLANVITGTINANAQLDVDGNQRSSTPRVGAHNG